MPRAARPGGTRLTYDQAEEIRAAFFARGETRAALARAWGTTWHNIHHIVMRITFKSRGPSIPLPDAVRARKRAASRRWAERNADSARIRSILGVHKRRAGGIGVTEAEWLAILGAFDQRCAYCGVRDKLTIDHVIPCSRGGTHEPGNVVPACGSCNFVKGKRGPLAMVNRNYVLRAA